MPHSIYTIYLCGEIQTINCNTVARGECSNMTSIENKFDTVDQRYMSIFYLLFLTPSSRERTFCRKLSINLQTE
jgi:hypothetical protein